MSYNTNILNTVHKQYHSDADKVELQKSRNKCEQSTSQYEPYINNCARKCQAKCSSRSRHLKTTRTQLLETIKAKKICLSKLVKGAANELHQRRHNVLTGEVWWEML